MGKRYVEYLMPVLVEVDVANKETTKVITFLEYIKPTGAVFGEDRVTLLPEGVERDQAIQQSQDNEEYPWPTWEGDK